MFEWVTLRIWRLIAAFAMAAALIASPAAAQQGSADKVVADYYGVLTEMWTKAEELGFQGRYDMVAPAVTEAFDMQTIAAASIGPHRWRALDERQKKALVSAFTRLSAATYASRFDEYSGQKFEILDREAHSGGRVLVKTQVVPAKGKPTDINYLMQIEDGTWKIIDVHLRGRISEVATRRSEFSSVIRNNGIDGLLEAIERKIEQLKTA